MLTPSIAVVIPVLNEEESLPALLEEIAKVAAANHLMIETVVVDDGSSDGTSAVAAEHGAIVLRSPRNQGKAAALQSGFDFTTDHDVVITMDGDLQDDPAEIPALLDRLRTSDLVSGWKRDRKDGVARRLQSRLYTWVVRLFTNVDLHDFNCGLKAYRRRVLDDVRLYGDMHRLIPVLAHQRGHRVAEMEVNHRPRLHGKSHYGLGRAVRGPLDLLTVVFLGRVGQRPLHLFGTIGLVVGTVGLAIGVHLTWVKLVGGENIGDRPLLLLGVLLMLVGMQMVGTGLIAEMLLATRPQGTSAHRLVARDDDPLHRTGPHESSEGATPV